MYIKEVIKYILFYVKRYESEESICYKGNMKVSYIRNLMSKINRDVEYFFMKISFLKL